MSKEVEIEHGRPLVEEDRADEARGGTSYDVGMATNPDVVVIRISGAFFFGAAAAVGTTLDRIGEQPKAHVIDMSAVPFMDSTGAATLESFVRRADQAGATVLVAGATLAVRRTLSAHGIKPPRVRFSSNKEEAIAAARGQDGLREA
jgi:SulP family sulfate permease